MTRTLVISQGALGDLTLSFPALLALAERTGRAPDLVCRPEWAAAPLRLGIAARVISTEKSIVTGLFADPPTPSSLEFLRDYDGIILFSFSRLLESACAASGAKVARIAPRPESGAAVHVARHLWNGLATAGLLPPAPGKLSDFPALARNKVEEEARAARPVLLHPGAGSLRKRWFLPGFVEVFKRLRKRGIPARFLAGPAEEDLAERLAALGVPPEDIALSGSADQLMDLLEDSAALVGNDSGVTHLAAFMGLPAVALFGPSDPARWRPLGPRVAVLRPGGLSCEPCFETFGENCEGAGCLAGTSVSAALEALCSLTRWRPWKAARSC